MPPTGSTIRRDSRSNRAGEIALHPGSINNLVQQAVARAGMDPVPYSAHNLRAGFMTYAHLCGASDRAIAHQTRHRSLATLGSMHGDGTSGRSRGREVALEVREHRRQGGAAVRAEI